MDFQVRAHPKCFVSHLVFLKALMNQFLSAAGLSVIVILPPHCFAITCLTSLQVLVLLTGGDWNPHHQSQWNLHANNLKNLPVDMYSFSIGSTPSQDKLQGVIPYNRNIFRVDSYDAADGRVPELVQAIKGGRCSSGGKE